MSNSDNKPKGKNVADPPMEELVIGAATYKTRLTAKFRNRETWSRPDERKVTAVIPGTIQEIMVKEGASVPEGTPLMILEAMKMKNKVLSPIEGVIKKIHVSEGDMVPKAHLLLEFK